MMAIHSASLHQLSNLIESAETKHYTTKYDRIRRLFLEEHMLAFVVFGSGDHGTICSGQPMLYDLDVELSQPLLWYFSKAGNLFAFLHRDTDTLAVDGLARTGPNKLVYCPEGCCIDIGGKQGVVVYGTRLFAAGGQVPRISRFIGHIFFCFSADSFFFWFFAATLQLGTPSTKSLSTTRSKSIFNVLAASTLCRVAVWTNRRARP
jgi:hypothetical protein